MRTLTVLTWVALAVGGCKKEQGSATPDDAAADAASPDVDMPGIDEGQSRVSEAEPDPVLTASSFEDTVAAHMQEVLDCYSEAQANNHKLAGRLVARFSIGPDGALQSVEAVEGSTLDDPGLVSCIETRAGTWRFEKPPSGEAMPMEFPFELAPG